ncbi:hypothetical protein DB895_08420 [Flavobacterium psychrotolerans]|uniref:Uncharacterized protein n=1 Tax=Flavobacterium psychrotolerans TaxID=2169410 RepID=A0A2U1JIT0_9FLAO|nr:hypothetical protein DB895_08420 [Flavobacterium psychrotolerans]
MTDTNEIKFRHNDKKANCVKLKKFQIKKSSCSEKMKRFFYLLTRTNQIVLPPLSFQHDTFRTLKSYKTKEYSYI